MKKVLIIIFSMFAMLSINGCSASSSSNINRIYSINYHGDKIWYQTDSRGNVIHFKDSDGFESWREYDSNNNEIHYKNSNGIEIWQKFDSNNKIYEKDSFGDESSIDVYGKVKVIEKWYSSDNNLKEATGSFYSKDSDGDESWYESGPHGNVIHFKLIDNDGKIMDER